MDKTAKLRVLAIATLWSLVVLWQHWNSLPTDIEAFYYGGKLWGSGAYDLLYAITRGPESLPRAAAIAKFGSPEYVDPFFYPPLWAALFAALAKFTSPVGFSNLLYLWHIPLIPLTALLVWRYVHPTMSAPVWLAISLTLVSVTLIGHQAVLQNQIQIMLTFLVILAFERETKGHPIAAGSALALAASIKLFPAIFVLAWLFGRGRNIRAVSAFGGIGAALATASLACGGLDLHLAFLHRLGQQSANVLIERTNWNLASFTYHLTHLADVLVTQPDTAAAGRSYSFQYDAPRPVWLVVFTALFLVSSTAFLLAKRVNAQQFWQRAAFLPAFAGVVALASPLTWAHHYFLVLYFVPTLPMLLGERAGWLSLIGFFLITQTTLNLHSNMWPILLQTGMVAGTMAILYVVGAFAFSGDNLRRDETAQRIADEDSLGKS